MIMAYNNYYGNPYFQQPNYYGNGAVPDMLGQQKMQYQQMQTPTPTPMQPQQQNTPTNDMIFVLNEVEAQSFPVAPNNTVTLWDKNQKTFYIKTVNAQGIPSLQTYDFVERSINAPKTPTDESFNTPDNFVTKDEFNALKGKLEDLTAKFNESAVTQVTKTNKNAKKGDAE
jgi:hypothetical protein